MAHKSYKVPYMGNSILEINQCKEGESIEQKLERMINNKEPMDGDGAPLIYNERKEGIKAQFNIKTDRMEVAIEAADKIAKSYKARRENPAKPVQGSRDPGDGKPESTQSKSEPDAPKN